MLIIDNGSVDQGLDFVQKNYPEVKILKNTHNLGYAEAHNQGIKIRKSDFLLIMNPDIILSPDFLKTMIEAAARHPEVTAFGGKTLKFHFKAGDLKEIDFTDRIDSVGLQPHKNRQFTNLGENEKDQGQYDQITEVFGISGGLIFITRNDLEKVKILNEYFDEDFFSYKEDIDLAWRFRLNRLKSRYIPQAVAYHHRQAQAPSTNKIKDIAKSRRLKSQFINVYSYRNHLLLLLKNEFFINLLRWFPHIFWYELKKFFYLILFEPKTLKIYFSFFGKIKRMYRKRKIILAHKHEIKKEVSRWFI